MTKKVQSTTPTAPNEKLVKSAIAEGKALIDQGKTKIEAAMTIYEKIENESQETIVKAFVEGATLTEKGALTYWYNCRRKLKKIRSSQSGDQPPLSEG